MGSSAHQANIGNSIFPNQAASNSGDCHLRWGDLHPASSFVAHGAGAPLLRLSVWLVACA
jgi:hypothetical protein